MAILMWKEFSLSQVVPFVSLHFFFFISPSASPGFWLCQAAPGPTGRGWGDPACQSGYINDVPANSGHATFTWKGPATRWNCQQKKPHHWQTQKVSLCLHIFSSSYCHPYREKVNSWCWLKKKEEKWNTKMTHFDDHQAKILNCEVTSVTTYIMSQAWKTAASLYHLTCQHVWGNWPDQTDGKFIQNCFKMYSFRLKANIFQRLVKSFIYV